MNWSDNRRTAAFDAKGQETLSKGKGQKGPSHLRFTLEIASKLSFPGPFPFPIRNPGLLYHHFSYLAIEGPPSPFKSILPLSHSFAGNAFSQ